MKAINYYIVNGVDSNDTENYYGANDLSDK